MNNIGTSTNERINRLFLTLISKIEMLRLNNSGLISEGTFFDFDSLSLEKYFFPLSSL